MSGPHFIHDDFLGHVPNPGFTGSGYGDSFHTINRDGLRSCGETAAPHDGSILAVGDSYTYGDEVRDEEAWPAQLQRLTGRRVLNGGVTGYGFDQTVLRAESLTALHRPSTLIAGFIINDLKRAEMSRMWWRNKPWFAMDDGRLVLKGVPVPDLKRPPTPVRRRIDSALVSLPAFVQHLVGYHRRVHRSGYGLEIAKSLIERLAEMQTVGQVRIVLMAQYPPDSWTNRGYMNYQRRLVKVMLDYAAKRGVATLDTFARLSTEPAPRAYYGNWHMNARGNLLVASLLAARLPALLQSQPA